MAATATYEYAVRDRSGHIVTGKIDQPGVIAPELLDRPARDEFIAEMGRREMPVTYRLETQIN